MSPCRYYYWCNLLNYSPRASWIPTEFEIMPAKTLKRIWVEILFFSNLGRKHGSSRTISHPGQNCSGLRYRRIDQAGKSHTSLERNLREVFTSEPYSPYSTLKSGVRFAQHFCIRGTVGLKCGQRDGKFARTKALPRSTQNLCLREIPRFPRPSERVTRSFDAGKLDWIWFDVWRSRVCLL